MNICLYIYESDLDLIFKFTFQDLTFKFRLTDILTVFF